MARSDNDGRPDCQDLMGPSDLFKEASLLCVLPIEGPPGARPLERIVPAHRVRARSR